MKHPNVLGKYPSLIMGSVHNDVTQWPSDPHFYRMNGDTPIFYQRDSVTFQIKRWVKYAKVWVDSCITDWPKFCQENGVCDLSGSKEHEIPAMRSDQYLDKHKTPDPVGPDFCRHGYDVACLICGFGTQDGVRVWHHCSGKSNG